MAADAETPSTPSRTASPQLPAQAPPSLEPHTHSRPHSAAASPANPAYQARGVFHPRAVPIDRFGGNWLSRTPSIVSPPNIFGAIVNPIQIALFEIKTPSNSKLNRRLCVLITSSATCLVEINAPDNPPAPTYIETWMFPVYRAVELMLRSWISTRSIKPAPTPAPTPASVSSCACSLVGSARNVPFTLRFLIAS